eukprot:38375_1
MKGDIDSKVDACLPCHSNVHSCPHLQSLKQTMEHYRKYLKDITQVKTVKYSLPNIDIVVNDFLHLYATHDTDAEFEIIMAEFTVCHVQQCQIIRHIYRNRSDEHTSVMNTILSDPYFQILNKIHCYYQHSFHMCNRLSANDKRTILKLHAPNTCTEDDKLVNSIILQTKQLLTKRSEAAHSLNTRSAKYTLSICDNKFEEKNGIENDKMYNFGAEFIYGYNYERRCHSDNPLKISPKFVNLKEELISNSLRQINVEQFNNEYQKATVYFNSLYYRKLMKSSLYAKSYGSDKFDSFTKDNKILLSILIYCNYDGLQYEFSKTYRQNVSEHNNYYHLGLYLKIATHAFGASMNWDSKLYHGIAEKLSFSAVMSSQCSGKGGFWNNGVLIYCPLSTSSCFTVAANFANHNRGLIIEFGYSASLSSHGETFFSTSWLSDFPSEKEHLFIQCRLGISITNIIDPQSGKEYEIILECLNVLRFILCASKYTDPPQGLNEKRVQYFICGMLNHQLFRLEKKGHRFGALNTYAEILVDTFCKNRTLLYTDMFQKKWKWYRFVYDFFFQSNDGFKFDLFMSIFPNIIGIYIEEINVCKFTMDTIVDYLKLNRVQLQSITFTLTKNSELSAEDISHDYRQIFGEIGYNLTFDVYHYRQRLYITV